MRDFDAVLSVFDEDMPDIRDDVPCPGERIPPGMRSRPLNLSFEQESEKLSPSEEL